jgi:hypothetical protein
MNFLLRTIVATFLVSSVLVACKNNSRIGLEVAPQGQNIGTYMQDTFTVNVSTILLDTIATTKTGNLWVGDYTDPNFGVLSAQTYSQLILGSPGVNLPEGAVFDSLSFILKYGDLKFGDTTKPFGLAIYQLTDTLNSNATYYHNSTIAYNATAIGNATFNPATFVSRNQDSIHIKLNDALGQDLFSKFGSATLSTQANFNAYFKGILLASDGLNASIIGGSFTSTRLSRMVLYCHKAAEPGNSIRYEFPISTLAKKFTHYDNNRSNTPLAGLVNVKDSVSALASSVAVIQAGARLGVKINIPNLKRLREQLGNVAINRAELIIRPIAIPNTGTNQAPFLIMHQLTANNLLYPVQIDGYSIAGTSYSQIIAYDYTSNQYSVFLTDYVQSLLYDKASPNYILSGSVSSPGNFVLGNQKHPTGAIKLKLYYTKID